MTPLPVIRSRVLDRIRNALPSPGAAICGALLWAGAMGTSALVNLLLDDWETAARIRFVSLLYAAGGALAFPVGLFLARFVSLGRHWEVALAAAFVCLLVATIGFTGGLFALHYRSYYVQWHAPALTIAWSIQFVHTVATAFYQFVVLGIRLYFPLGFIALALASIWFARRQR